MKIIMHFLVGASTLGFLILLFLSYRDMTPLFNLANAGIPVLDEYLGRDYFFYGMFVMFLLFNLPIFGLIRSVDRIPALLLPSLRPAVWKKDQESKSALKRLYKNWGYALMCAFNVLFIALSLNITAYNHQDGNVQMKYNDLISISIIVLGFTLLLPMVRLIIPTINLIAPRSKEPSQG